MNAVMTATYWAIGGNIVKEEQRGAAREGYGEQLVIKLSRNLQARFGRGFGRANLFQMKAFFLAYREMVQTVSGLSEGDGPAKIVQIASGKSGAAAGLAAVAARFNRLFPGLGDRPESAGAELPQRGLLGARGIRSKGGLPRVRDNCRRDGRPTVDFVRAGLGRCHRGWSPRRGPGEVGD